MKRRIDPVREYTDDAGYPSVNKEGLSRRDFFRRAVATTAAAAGAVAVSREGVAAPGRKDKDKRERVSVYLDRYRRIGATQLSPQKVDIFTTDKALTKFLRGSGRNQSRDKMMKVLRKIKEDSLYNGKKLVELERKLSQAVAQEYRKRTGKLTRPPDLMLYVSPYYYRHMGGVVARPHYPHP